MQNQQPTCSGEKVRVRDSHCRGPCRPAPMELAHWGRATERCGGHSVLVAGRTPSMPLELGEAATARRSRRSRRDSHARAHVTAARPPRPPATSQHTSGGASC